MKTIDNENIVTFDVDDTLVMWEVPQRYAHQTMPFDGFGIPTTFLPHLKHIKLLKEFKARGHFVIVWSQGGKAWAEAVVKALGIEEYVDIAMTKPKWTIDDLPPSAWMSRSYLNLEGKRVDLNGPTEASPFPVEDSYV